MAQTDFDPYALFDALRAGGDVDKIRSSVEFVLQALIEVEATEAIGAAPSEWKRRQASLVSLAGSAGRMTPASAAQRRGKEPAALSAEKHEHLDPASPAPYASPD